MSGPRRVQAADLKVGDKVLIFGSCDGKQFDGDVGEIKYIDVYDMDDIPILVQFDVRQNSIGEPLRWYVKQDMCFKVSAQ